MNYSYELWFKFGYIVNITCTAIQKEYQTTHTRTRACVSESTYHSWGRVVLTFRLDEKIRAEMN
jgi:hypothetical protein